MTTARIDEISINTDCIEQDVSEPLKPKNDSEIQSSMHSASRSSLISVIAPSIAFFGCQFSWAVQDGNVSPFLRELGMTRNTINYAWLLGPISGLIFQPIIGVFSDHCTLKLGRRRPFIICGSIILSICLIIFCNSKLFSFLTFSNPLIIAFLTFWQLDFSTNLLEGPLRAITSDTLTHCEQLQSHSWFGIMNGFASIIGFALGYFIGNIQIIFPIAAIIMIISVIITSILVKEKNIRNISNISETQTKTNMREILATNLKQLISGLFSMPYIIKQCWLIQFCSYFGHFACWIYLCDYFGTQIMNGSPNTNNGQQFEYKLGIEYGNLSFMFISIISVIFSFIITKIVNIFGIKFVWIGCLFIYSFILMSSIFINNLYFALFIFSFIGIPMSASFTIPWTIIGIYSNKYDQKNACLYATILNIAECGPELIIALFSGFIVQLFNGNVAGVLVVAGIVNFVGVILIFNTDLNEYNTFNQYNNNNIKQNNNNNLDEIKVLLKNDDDQKILDEMEQILTGK